MTASYQASLSFTVSQSLLKLMSIELMVSIQPSHPLLPPSLLSSVFPSIMVFSNELGLCIRWLKYWSFSFSISPSNEHSGLISFRIVWFDLVSVQGTLKESSPVLQLENINSLAFSLLYGPASLSIHDYWENHIFDQTDLCWQSDVSAF